MADIELVIKIPEEMWERVKDGYVPIGISKYLKNGVLLPKGHGRLIDEDDLMAKMVDFCVVYDEIMETPTIVEEDTAESEG